MASISSMFAEELQRRGYCDDVKGLIETMYHGNGGKKVAVVAHSIGAPIMLHIFTQSGVVTQEWKDQYIGNFIPIARAWSGGNEAIQSLISGLRIDSRGPGFILKLYFYTLEKLLALNPGNFFYKSVTWTLLEDHMTGI